MNKVYLLIGGNIGDRLMVLSRTREAITKNCGSIIRSSSVYETAAWGKEDQAAFLNQALEIETPLEAGTLLAVILETEKMLGRERQEKYGPRIIDIDIIFFNDAVIEMQGLKVPHPHMQDRRFVLMPLSEIAPRKQHPVLHKTVAQLLKDCSDTLPVNKFS